MRRHLAVFAVGFMMFVAVSAPGQVDPQAVADFEDLDKTMSIFEGAFTAADEKLLRSVSSESFERSAEFRRLRDGLGRFHINSALSSQTAEQVFDLEPGPGELVVSFRLRDRQWIVETARISGMRRAETTPIPLLAREYYFSDFRRLIEAGKGAGLFTATANAVLDPRLKGKKLLARSETNVTITGLALFEGDRLTDLIYVRARKSYKVDQRSRGWLIESSGSALQLAKESSDNRALLEYLSGNEQAFRSQQRESAFIFANVEASDEPSLPVTHVDFKVEKIAASGFKWDDRTVQFSVSVDCSGASWQPPYKVNLEGGKLTINTHSDAQFVGAPPSHRYLNVSTSDGTLTIRVKEDASKRPIASFQNAVIKRHWTKMIDGGIRFVVEVAGSRFSSRE